MYATHIRINNLNIQVTLQNFKAINDYETCNGKSKTKSANQKAVDFIIQVSTN